MSIERELIELENFLALYPQNTLCEAIKMGQANYLVSTGLTKLAKDKNVQLNGWTALMYAAQNHCVNLVEILIREGVSLDAQDNNGYTALIIATESGSEKIVGMLINAGAGKEYRANMGNEYKGVTALMFAAENQQVEILRMLLNAGADLHASDDVGFTALSWATNNNTKAAVCLLLQSGADVNHRDKCGETALMLAAQKDDEGLVRLLLREGAQIDARDNEGRTAITHAWSCREKDKRIIEILLSYGANPFNKSRNGKYANNSLNNALEGYTDLGTILILLYEFDETLALGEDIRRQQKQISKLLKYDGLRPMLEKKIRVEHKINMFYEDIIVQKSMMEEMKNFLGEGEFDHIVEDGKIRPLIQQAIRMYDRKESEKKSLKIKDMASVKRRKRAILQVSLLTIFMSAAYFSIRNKKKYTT